MIFLKRLTTLSALCCCCISITFAQEYVLQDVENPDFITKKINLPYRSNFRHVSIGGLHPDGRLLIYCSPDRNDARYNQPFWVSLSGDSVTIVEATPNELPDFYLKEIARYDRNTLYYTSEDRVGVHFYRSKADKQGKFKPGHPVSLEKCWDKIEITNPFIYHPLTSNHPILLFCAKAGGKRKDTDIFYSELIDDGWTCPQPVPGAGVNTEGYNESHPYVDKEGYLFFCSNRPHPDAEAGSKHDKDKFDLYCTTRSYKPFWQDAEVNPLPSPFNTEGDERTIAPVQPGLGAGFLVSDRYDGSLQLYAFKSTALQAALPPLRYHALVAGVSNYEQFDDLPSPVSESRQVAQILTERYGFITSTLENPTSAQFLERLAQYQQLDENEYLLVVFFGHGFRYDSLDDDDPTIRSVLAGRDCECTDWADDGLTMNKTKNCITPGEFIARLNLISKPKHILVLLDVCYGGMFIPINTRENGVFDDKSRRYIASTANKPTSDQSHFFVGLTNKLNDGPKHSEGEMPGQELYDAIEEHMKNNGAENKPAYESYPGYNENSRQFTFPQKRY